MQNANIKWQEIGSWESFGKASHFVSILQVSHVSQVVHLSHPFHPAQGQASHLSQKLLSAEKNHHPIREARPPLLRQKGSCRLAGTPVEVLGEGVVVFDGSEVVGEDREVEREVVSVAVGEKVCYVVIAGRSVGRAFGFAGDNY